MKDGQPINRYVQVCQKYSKTDSVLVIVLETIGFSEVPCLLMFVMFVNYLNGIFLN